MADLDLPVITFTSPYQTGTVEVEITTRQVTEPLPGPGGLYVIWTLSRGLAEVKPVIGPFEARQQFVVIFEGRESGGSGNLWYCAEASDVASGDRHVMGTGKTPRESFENFCERCDTLLSVEPGRMALAEGYGDADTVGNMRHQATRCFKPRA